MGSASNPTEQTEAENPEGRRVLPRRQLRGKRRDVQTQREGRELVGNRVEVWWALDKQFYSGIVENYHSSGGKFSYDVRYDDGDYESGVYFSEYQEIRRGDDLVVQVRRPKGGELKSEKEPEPQVSGSSVPDAAEQPDSEAEEDEPIFALVAKASKAAASAPAVSGHQRGGRKGQPKARSGGRAGQKAESHSGKQVPERPAPGTEALPSEEGGVVSADDADDEEALATVAAGIQRSSGRARATRQLRSQSQAGLPLEAPEEPRRKRPRRAAGGDSEAAGGARPPAAPSAGDCGTAAALSAGGGGAETVALAPEEPAEDNSPGGEAGPAETAAGAGSRPEALERPAPDLGATAPAAGEQAPGSGASPKPVGAPERPVRVGGGGRDGPRPAVDRLTGKVLPSSLRAAAKPAAAQAVAPGVFQERPGGQPAVLRERSPIRSRRPKPDTQEPASRRKPPAGPSLPAGPDPSTSGRRSPEGRPREGKAAAPERARLGHHWRCRSVSRMLQLGRRRAAGQLPALADLWHRRPSPEAVVQQLQQQGSPPEWDRVSARYSAWPTAALVPPKPGQPWP